jgi:hypothetical protein
MNKYEITLEKIRIEKYLLIAIPIALLFVPIILLIKNLILL